MALPRLTLGNYLGDCLTHTMLITAFLSIIDPKAAGSLLPSCVQKPCWPPIGIWSNALKHWGSLHMDNLFWNYKDKRINTSNVISSPKELTNFWYKLSMFKKKLNKWYGQGRTRRLLWRLYFILLICSSFWFT